MSPASSSKPKTATRIKTKKWPCCQYFWAKHAVIKVVVLSALAMYDIIGDLAFLADIRRYPLIGLINGSPSGDVQIRVSEEGTWDAQAQSYVFDDVDKVLNCLNTARYHIHKYQRGVCDAFYQYTTPQKTTTTPTTTSSNSWRSDALYFAVENGDKLATTGSGDSSSHYYNYYAYLYNTEAVQLVQTYTTCFDEMKDKTMACLTGLSSTNTLDVTFSLEGISYGGVRDYLHQWHYIVFSSSSRIPTITIMAIAYALLAVILLKETVKAMGVLSFFFHPYFHNPKNFVFISNSPMTFLPLLCSSAFRTTALYVESTKEDSPWPLFWDLLLEDLPQLFLPIFLIYISRSHSAVAIFSLTGSIAMVVVAIIRLIPKLQREHVKAMSPMNSSLIATTGGDVEMATATVSPNTSPPSAEAPFSLGPEVAELKARMAIMEGGFERILQRLGQLEGQLLQHIEAKTSSSATSAVPKGEGGGHEDDRGAPAIV